MGKLFVALAILCFFGSVLVQGFDKEAAKAALKEKAQICKGEVGASDSDITELNEKKPASTKEGKCLRSCVMKKCKVMNDNGKFDKDTAMSHAKLLTDGDEDKMKIATEIIDHCSVIDVDDDECEAAEQYGKCLKEQAVAHKIDEEFDM